MRVDSEHPSQDGGWYHFFDAKRPKVVYSKSITQGPSASCYPTINFGKIMRDMREQTDAISIARFAKSLGVRATRLASLGIAWSHKHRAWAFPMRDAFGETVGVRLRSETGAKWSITGSKQGIFAPASFDSPKPALAIILEGPTDTAAALSLGFAAIGRPSCNSGNEIVKTWLKCNNIYKAIIVADNDDKLIVGVRRYPGLLGASNLKRALDKTRTVIWLPQAKDFRQMVQLGATREMVESEVNNLVWTKG